MPASGQRAWQRREGARLGLARPWQLVDAKDRTRDRSSGAPGCLHQLRVRGCGSWQKIGTRQQTISQDTAECRESAQEEVLRRYPYRAGSPSLGAMGAILSQQRDDNSRASTEASLFNNCMQSRGYRRAPVSR